MMETYRVDMSKSLQIIASKRGLSTTYEILLKLNVPIDQLNRTEHG